MSGFDKAYRAWKKANAPQHHIAHLLKSPQVDATVKHVLRAEFARLNATTEPLRQACIAARAQEKAVQP